MEISSIKYDRVVKLAGEIVVMTACGLCGAVYEKDDHDIYIYIVVDAH